ncbi:MAG: transporter [Methylococcales bacterium]|nr:transporter [Methylococcales bacterium]
MLIFSTRTATQWLTTTLLAILLLTTPLFADTIDNPGCSGPSALLNIIDRPSVADSPCVVPHKHLEVEMGYQYFSLINASGDAQGAPAAQLRIGLLNRTEFTVLLPTYTHFSHLPYSGINSTTVGLKHELGYSKQWIATVESLLTLPGGSSALGTPELGAAFNGIVSYAPVPFFSASLMLGATTTAIPHVFGGGRYTSVNPDLVLTYYVTQTLLSYVEFYGQSRTGIGIGSGSGVNADVGIVRLFTPDLTLDVAYFQRLNGALGNFERGVTMGLALMF